MKKVISILFIYFSFTCFGFAQDVIRLKAKEDSIQAKVIEINSTEVKYKKSNNINGPTIVTPKSEILMIRYENGIVDTFEESVVIVKDTTKNPNDLYRQGVRDASLYYDGYTGAGTGIFIVSLISPLLGLIPAAACSTTQPKDINLDYPNPKLMKDINYSNGYKYKATRIKSGKVWTNWVGALGLNFVAVIFIYSMNK